MRRPDELALFAVLRPLAGALPAMVEAERIGIHPLRAQRILEKWDDRGWLDCGVSIRAPWWTESAPPTLAP